MTCPSCEIKDLQIIELENRIVMLQHELGNIRQVAQTAKEIMDRHRGIFNHINEPHP